MQSCMDMNWTWELMLLVDFMSTVLTNISFRFSKSRMVNVSGVSDPKREKEVPSKGTKQKLLRSTLQSAPTQPAVILPPSHADTFPCRMLLHSESWDRVGEWDGERAVRIWGQRTSLRSNSRWRQNLFPIQNRMV